MRFTRGEYLFLKENDFVRFLKLWRLWGKKQVAFLINCFYDFSRLQLPVEMPQRQHTLHISISMICSALLCSKDMFPVLFSSVRFFKNRRQSYQTSISRFWLSPQLRLVAFFVAVVCACKWYDLYWRSSICPDLQMTPPLKMFVNIYTAVAHLSFIYSPCNTDCLEIRRRRTQICLQSFTLN